MLLSIISGFRYIFVAFSTKLYYNIELWLSLPGAAAFYGLITLIGYAEPFHFLHSQYKFDTIYHFRFIVMYVILPETEGKSLDDIELHFSDNEKPITNINIQKIPKENEIS